ncbi:MAG: SH3 domain-containing protein, partial [Candidatus Aminicenantes bacterium]|nr:SH3 domain-containing protein [Candidatus Aminicenantes bacterium]
MRCRPWLWISLSLLLFGSGLLQASPQNTSPRVKVVAEQANIRLRPSITSIIIYQAPQGSIFKLIAKEGEWYKIEFQTETGETSQGFVHESLVVRLEPKKRITSPAKKSSPPVHRQFPQPKSLPP